MADKYSSDGSDERANGSSESKSKMQRYNEENSESDEFEYDVERSYPPAGVARDAGVIPYTGVTGGVKDSSAIGGYQPDASWKMQSHATSDRLTAKQPAPTGTLAWVGFGCCLLALACLTISFCSPYWLQTWPMSENRFKNVGLWHVCFNNYMHFKDDSQQVYSGCWWVFDKQPKYYKLREWLTPPWFISCQVLTTGCLIVEIVTTVTMALIFLHYCPLLNHEYLQTYGVFASASMMFLVAMVSFVVAVLFGVQVNDRYWMPRPDQNFLSWGFGFLVISGIFSLISGVTLFKAGWEIYSILLRKEDDYTKAALEASLYNHGDATDYGDTVVMPGSSALNPPSYSLRDSGKDTYPEPEPVPAGATFSSQMPSDDFAAQAPALPVKQPALDPYDPSMPPYSSTLSSNVPEFSAFGRGIEPQRDSAAFTPSASDQPHKPAAYGGKSFGKSYERRYSDASFDDPDLEDFVPKVERQY